ncbi:F-box only protein 28 [Anopheles nili]|uniref:F-box only protein 28 n=1 Tax=Anopheles nili TaxID=185578 RepID=UPI00237A2CE8|nr:F-box only protein 28 [Anopheles nili]
MVSTRQMTGATSDESNLHLYRVLPTTTSTPSSPSLMDLPTELLEHIFSFLGYKKIGHMRVLSRQVNHVCSSILNSTFQKLQNQMHTRFQNVKAKMPRRESARRNHPLACECDILETCYMRLSLLQMTFGKHIERKHCCFFPGGILDEVYSVLNYIRTSPALDRPYKVTDELFDLSTMAMEYFKEHIEPNLPDIAYFSKFFLVLCRTTKSFTALETSSSILSRDTSHSNSSSPPQSNMVLRKGIRKIKQGMKRYNNQLSVLRSELRTCKRKATEQTKTITEHQKLLAEQQKQTLEFANRLDETDKKNDELSRKFSTVLQELNKCKTELQYWRSKSPATTNCNPHGQFFLPHELQALGSQPVTSDDIEHTVQNRMALRTASHGIKKKQIDQISNYPTD